MSSAATTSTPTGPVVHNLSAAQMVIIPEVSTTSDHTKCSRLGLAPNDWILPAYTRILCCFFYDIKRWKKTSDTEEFMSSDSLKSSLTKMLTQVPLLSGRLIPSPKDGRHEVALSNEGASWVTAESVVKLEELPLSAEEYTSMRSLPASLQLTAKIDYTAPLSGPLLHVQHTRFACGSVCLGVVMHHFIGDGESYFGFMNDWAETHRTGALPQIKFHQDRSFAIIRPEEVAARLLSHKEEAYILNDPTKSAPTIHVTGQTRVTIAKVFRFGSKELNALKEQAMKDAFGESVAVASSSSVTSPSSDRWISTYEALTAHIHQLSLLARHPDASKNVDGSEKENINLLLSTNWRKRLKPQVPEKYFGNAALWTGVPQLRADLAKNTLGQNALVIHNTLAARSSDSLRATMAWITAQENVAQIGWAYNPTSDMVHTQWSKMSMYNAAFHTNVTPTRICFPHVFTGLDGVIVTMSVDPNGEDSEALDVVVALEESEMVKLEGMKEFRKFRQM